LRERERDGWRTTEAETRKGRQRAEREIDRQT